MGSVGSTLLLSHSGGCFAGTVHQTAVSLTRGWINNRSHHSEMLCWLCHAVTDPGRECRDDPPNNVWVLYLIIENRKKALSNVRSKKGWSPSNKEGWPSPQPWKRNRTRHSLNKKEESSPQDFRGKRRELLSRESSLPLGTSLFSLEKSEETSLLARDDRDAPPLDNVWVLCLIIESHKKAPSNFMKKKRLQHLSLFCQNFKSSNNFTESWLATAGPGQGLYFFRKFQ